MEPTTEVVLVQSQRFREYNKGNQLRTSRGNVAEMLSGRLTLCCCCDFVTKRTFEERINRHERGQVPA